MKATIQHVAEEAGVSVSTVSRAFTKPDLVARKTRDRILAIADNLDFRISRSATALKTGQSLRVAFLTSDPLATWFNAHVFEGMNSVLQQAGYDISLYQIDTPEKRHDFFSILPVQRNADAVIVSSFDIDPTETGRLNTAKVPIIGINVPTTTSYTASISIDDAAGMQLLAQHLITLGHRQIAFVGVPQDSKIHFSAHKRERAFVDTCLATSITPSVIHVEDDDELVSNVMTALLNLAQMPTAVCFQHDSMAIRLWTSLRKYGMECPHDISICGFDDSTYAKDISLTTIRQDPQKTGQAAAEKTLRLMAGDSSFQTHQLVPVHLIARESTAKVSASS